MMLRRQRVRGRESRCRRHVKLSAVRRLQELKWAKAKWRVPSAIAEALRVPKVVIYCDGESDELAAKLFLTSGSLKGAAVERLPTLAEAPGFLKPLLTWERLDWVVAVDDEVRCTIEISRHGYTGDNGFQRFARLYRSASLGIPTVYFTPFNRTRLNELDESQSNPRNVAPELFLTLADLQKRFGVACLAVAWPTKSTNGQPAPMQDPDVQPVMARLGDFVARCLQVDPSETPGVLSAEFPDLDAAMKAHAEKAFRGGDTRHAVTLPIDIGDPTWIYEFLPESYFRLGKAEKALATLALDSCATRPVDGAGPPFWKDNGKAWVLYLGYQWRPDPSCGLIALAAAQAHSQRCPLIVVWPRVFQAKDGQRAKMLEALTQFKTTADGPLKDELEKHGRTSAIQTFSDRVSVDPGQFGVFTPGSKIGRVLSETASALVLGDAVLTWAHD